MPRCEVWTRERRPDRDLWRQAGRASELGIAGEASGAGNLTDKLGGGQRPEPRLVEQLRRDLRDQVSDLGLERVDRLGQLA